jgi:hypothetical protein
MADRGMGEGETDASSGGRRNDRLWGCPYVRVTVAVNHKRQHVTHVASLRRVYGAVHS